MIGGSSNPIPVPFPIRSTPEADTTGSRDNTVVNSLRARWWSIDRRSRLRLVGLFVLACGVASAVVFYWIATRNAVPELDEAAAGYARAQEYQMRRMMGPLGVTMTQWVDALSRPGTQALLIVGFAAFVAYMCFRHASFPDRPDERHDAR